MTITEPLSAADYDEYIRSAEWKAKTANVLLRHHGECALCRAKATQVHHRHYDRLGVEAPGDLVPLCTFHHLQVAHAS